MPNPDNKVFHKLPGMTLESLKKNIYVLPMFCVLGFAVTMCAAFSIRSMLKEPDVAWRKSSNPNSNEDYREKQFKLYSPTLDYSKIKSQAPKYWEEDCD